MKHIILIYRLNWLLFLLVTFSVEAQISIPFADGIKSKKEINISTISSDIKYIALETTQDCLLEQGLTNVTFAGTSLFVCDGYNLFKFTNEGKFVTRIGKKGQGPGEYLMINSVKYNDVKKEIYLSDALSGNIIVYSYDGIFLRNIKIGKREYLLFYDGMNRFYVSVVFFYHEGSKKEIIVYDNNGSEIFDFPFRPKQGIKYPGLLISVPITYFFDKRAYYKSPVETTIYQLDGNKKTPVYNIDLGKYELLMYENDLMVNFVDNETAMSSINKDTNDKISFYNIFETKDFLGVHFTQHEHCFAIYHKLEKTISRVRGLTAKVDGFTDDIQNGYPIFPYFYSNNAIISYVSAEKLIENIKLEKVGLPLKQIMKNIKYDDNPVLQVVKVK